MSKMDNSANELAINHKKYRSSAPKILYFCQFIQKTIFNDEDFLQLAKRLY